MYNQLDESRVLSGPGLSVYVPRAPKNDFSPRSPPEVHYLGITAIYWTVLREGKMPLLSGTKRFSEQQMDWLHSVEEEVSRLTRT